MKSLSAKRQTHIALESQTSAEFARIERTDGVTIGVTNHIENVTLNGVVYYSGYGYTPTAVTDKADYSPNSIDVEGILATAGVDRTDIEGGLFDGARIYIFATDYTDPVVDEHPMLSGFWGKVTLLNGRYTTEFSSLKDSLSQPIGRTHKAGCDATFGSTRCGVRINPDEWQASTAYTVREDQDAATGSVVRPSTDLGVHFKCTVAGTSGGSEPSWDTTPGNTTTDGSVTWEAFDALTKTGTVTGVTDRRIFADSTRTESDDHWNYGTVTFTSGNNNGLEMEIKDFISSTGTFELFLPMPADIAASDTYTVRVGCTKRFTEDCIALYDNADNFQGFPFIPTTDQAGKFGGQ